MEGDCVLEPTVCCQQDSGAHGGEEVHELEADVGQVKRLGRVGEVDCRVHGSSSKCPKRNYAGE